ncbi:hypothetical protein EON83_15450 [bacterium]|nr:MAG: hypothetical protein EON83_15450 [bacterium]
MNLKSALLFVSLLPVLGSCASAQTPPKDAAVPVANQPAPAQSRMGMNLAGPADWNTELPFNDVFHFSRYWISQRRGEGWGKGPKLSLDEHGWVKALEPNCFAETPMLTDMRGQFPHGQYVCLYEGKGEVKINNASKIVSSAPGRIVFEPQAESGIFLQILSTEPTDYIRNIRVLMPGTEKTVQDNPFNPVFLERWKGVNTLRFMDWMQTNGSQVKEWNERPKTDDATWSHKGIPLEIMIDLCNKQKQNGWFCLPVRASDDYVLQFATMLKARLKPSLKAYIEYSNEVWNGGFEQCHYVGEQGMALKLGEKPWEAGWHYTGRRSKEIFAVVDRAFGGREAASKRIVRVIATQGANAYVSEQILGFEDTGKNADALAVAPYFGLMSPSRAADPNSKVPAETVATWTTTQVLDYLENVSIPETIKWNKEQKAIADKYGLKLIAYEGGQHAVGTAGGENNEDLTKLFLAANRDERMGQLYTKYLDTWRDCGGDVFCNFSSVSGWSKWGSWGLLENQNDDTAKYRAVMNWNAANTLKN